MNVAWGGLCCSSPPSIAISLRKATYTYGNIVERKAFTIDVMRNYNLGNTIKGTFILNSSSCQPEVNEGSNISKSLIVIHDFMTVYLSQNLIFFHTT